MLLCRSVIHMSTAKFDHIARLEAALKQRGNPVSAVTFMDVLREINDLEGASKGIRIDSAES